MAIRAPDLNELRNTLPYYSNESLEELAQIITPEQIDDLSLLLPKDNAKAQEKLTILKTRDYMLRVQEEKKAQNQLNDNENHIISADSNRLG